MKTMDRNYIKMKSKRTVEDVDNENYDSAVTKARTSMKEIFLYALELKEDKSNSKDDIG